MDYLQYSYQFGSYATYIGRSFKPYYKWITFNTNVKEIIKQGVETKVLNLIINGLPSIQKMDRINEYNSIEDFVLNLIINGLPSILKY